MPMDLICAILTKYEQSLVVYEQNRAFLAFIREKLRKEPILLYKNPDILCYINTATTMILFSPTLQTMLIHSKDIPPPPTFSERNIKIIKHLRAQIEYWKKPEEEKNKKNQRCQLNPIAENADVEGEMQEIAYFFDATLEAFMAQKFTIDDMKLLQREFQERTQRWALGDDDRVVLRPKQNDREEGKISIRLLHTKPKYMDQPVQLEDYILDCDVKSTTWKYEPGEKSTPVSIQMDTNFKRVSIQTIRWILKRKEAMKIWQFIDEERVAETEWEMREMENFELGWMKDEQEKEISKKFKKIETIWGVQREDVDLALDPDNDVFGFLWDGSNLVVAFEPNICMYVQHSQWNDFRWKYTHTDGQKLYLYHLRPSRKVGDKKEKMWNHVLTLDVQSVLVRYQSTMDVKLPEEEKEDGKMSPDLDFRDEFIHTHYLNNLYITLHMSKGDANKVGASIRGKALGVTYTSETEDKKQEETKGGQVHDTLFNMTMTEHILMHHDQEEQKIVFYSGWMLHETHGYTRVGHYKDGNFTLNADLFIGIGNGTFPADVVIQAYLYERVSYRFPTPRLVRVQISNPQASYPEQKIIVPRGPVHLPGTPDHVLYCLVAWANFGGRHWVSVCLTSSGTYWLYDDKNPTGDVVPWTSPYLSGEGRAPVCLLLERIDSLF